MTDDTNGTSEDQPEQPEAVEPVSAPEADQPDLTTLAAQIAGEDAPGVASGGPPSGGQRVIAERYELGELTGRTAMLETYQARDRVLGTTVDVKFLSSQLAEDKAFAERFLAEAEAAAAIDHPGVVRILGAGMDSGQHYLILEQAEGETLLQALRRSGPMEAQRAADIVAKVCSALAAAHDKGIAHGDINPSVILLAADDQVKVTEFGVARIESPQTVAQTRAIMGTAAYLSPEQAQGEQADGRSDIYSTGVVLYELLTGKPPFTADSPVAVAYMHVRDTPKPVGEVTPDLPTGIADATMKALAKKPGERFATAAEFAVALAPMAAPAMATPAGDAVKPAAEPATMVFGPAPGASRGGLSTRTKVIIGVVAAVLAIAALYVFLLMPRNVRVPTVINMSQAQAEQLLEDAGLKVQVSEQESNEVAPGTVFYQAPAAASVVRKGTTVIITVAKEASNITVPNVVGLAEADAKAELERAGLELGTVTVEASETAPAGTVLSQNPVAGTLVPGVVAVDITVAQLSGPTIVPNITCNTADRAATILDEAGLKMTVVGVETDPAYTSVCPMDGRSRITQTNPAAGTPFSEGGIVQVWTTIPLPESTPSPAPTSPSASPFPSPVDPSATASLP